MKPMKPSCKTLVSVLIVSFCFSAVSFAKVRIKNRATKAEIQALKKAMKDIESLGFKEALQKRPWIEVPSKEELTQSGNRRPFDPKSVFASQYGSWDNEVAWDYCNYDSTSSNCSGYYPSGTGVSAAVANLRNDGLQILATEVLAQTLDFFRVKHVFGKVGREKQAMYLFKVIEPADGAPFQDLDTEAVVFAIKQFRKYVAGLLCNDPDPTRVLALMNRYDVGKRFRWDMAWALLGNDLPDAPNKYMRFGLKWRKFSMAMDGIENGSFLRVQNAFGGQTGIDPGTWNTGTLQPPASGATGAAASVMRVGFIAKEVISMIRLVGDIAAATLELRCVSDLSIDPKKEEDKKTVVYKLLEVKKKALDRYGPLRPILDEIGKKATEAAGQTITVTP